MLISIIQFFPLGKSYTEASFLLGNPTLGPDFRGKFYPGKIFRGAVRFQGGNLTLQYRYKDEWVKVTAPPSFFFLPFCWGEGGIDFILLYEINEYGATIKQKL